MPTEPTWEAIVKRALELGIDLPPECEQPILAGARQLHEAVLRIEAVQRIGYLLDQPDCAEKSSP